MNSYYPKSQRWALRYISKRDGAERICYPQSEEKKNEQLAICKDRGITVLSCRKLYPFSTEKNQHNFDLIHNICMNRMDDMRTGEVAWNESEYDRLDALREKAEKYFLLPAPIAWLPYEELVEARELAAMAVLHRQEACIANGRPDLVAGC
jgi:hypothetical protein